MVFSIPFVLDKTMYCIRIDVSVAKNLVLFLFLQFRVQVSRRYIMCFVNDLRGSRRSNS